ncbi:hypothetical protein [Paenibacillus sp. NAIST15-1]|uniref:hypothetical protein n=1 Tax=Paenibacillus sp. NAIST15-1 TaxID=1605994 RepID=UPI00086A8279|nr:hypothetical protein [Paenibacillus sp. NAIST15-1]GAV11313.1 hypothetical protein PBN151_1240 [Paenibacillus sp. NAIST15-1]
MNKLKKKVIKLLESNGYDLEVEGHIIYTPNCTIEIRNDQITVNEQPIDYNSDIDEIYYAVAEVEG